MPSSNQQIQVTGTGGLRGVLLDPIPRDPDEPVRIQLGDKRVLEAPAGLLTARSDGSYSVPFSPDDIDRMYQSTDAREPAASREQTVIPVVAEELDVQKRAVQTGGVRVHRRVLEHEEEIDMPLLREHVHVRRVLLDREVEGPLPIREEGNSIVIPIVEEVLVVSRRYRLKEEVYVTKTSRQERHQERVAVRRQEAVIQEFDADGRPMRVD
ncbi:MAG TPA: YsnF/AvaK domain-containing protein [Bryobacteraceae bacterium]|nr:YsnF/AvaK domain-containing protein [Bryobacteraceae bacterium]